jgi:hypothetical protein
MGISNIVTNRACTGVEFLANKMLSKMRETDPPYSFPVNFDKYVPKK